MDVLFIGQNSSGKTSNIKKYLQLNNEKKTIILDFSNQFDDFSENVLYLDDINPLLEEISLTDIVALNSGYLSDSRCLYNKSIEVLKEYFAFDSLGYNSFEEFSKHYSKIGLVEDSIERLQNSWNNVESSYGKILNKKVPIKKQEKHIPLSTAIDFIDNHNHVVLKSKNMHSDRLRAVAFIILSRLSLSGKENYTIVGDELSLFFNNGNIKMFEESINRSKLNFIVSFNKCSNIPKTFFPTFDYYFIHCFESNSEIRELNQMGIYTIADIKKLPVGKFIKLEKNKEGDEVHA